MVYPKELEHFLFDSPMKIGIWLTLLYVIDIKIVTDMWLSSCVNSTLWIAAGMIIIFNHSFILRSDEMDDQQQYLV